MSNELLINMTSHETRVALVEEAMVTELHIERASERGIMGNIYKGRVVRILPGMQAAFVDIGLERAAFIYAGDVYENTNEYGLMMGVDDEENVAIEPEPGYHIDREVPIEDMLQEGQEILVQVSKEPMGTKGARITSHISLPGRNLVLMPAVDHVGVSRRIEDEKERKRLRELVQSVKPQGFGFIIRTAGEGASLDKLKADMDFLLQLWEQIIAKKNKAPTPSLIHSDLDASLRAVRDLFTKDVDRLIIDSREEYEKILQFIDLFMPKLKPAVELYEEDEPIFDAYGIEMEIARALGRKVWLKSGGYITIDITEALTAIDVNTGKYVGKHNLEDTILKTNLESVKEITYQLRLRNIGGIIIIDFIDMERQQDRDKVFNALINALQKDKSKTNILKISELGLVQMTRKRTRENLTQTLGEPCSYCDGEGYLKSRTTMGYEVIRAIQREISDASTHKIYVRVHPDVADFLLDMEHEMIEQLERRFEKRITINANSGFHQEQYDIRSE
ncbi:MAG: Rne/Rng family ribonuclease [Deltaproteobacteria bacterium]|nr:Rne/Rng family ribonuclease [Deltaproteobacteria bacterium]